MSYIKVIYTDINLVTISNSIAEDILIEDYEFDESPLVCVLYEEDQEQYDSDFKSLKSIILEATKMQVSNFKIMPGYEWLYLTEVCIIKNLVFLRIEKNER